MTTIEPVKVARSRSELHQTQRLRKAALWIGVAMCIGLLLVSQSAWQTSAPHVYQFIQRVGILLILICILGRTWCTLYIGGVKKKELVTQGPYSVVRNPLYFFTLIGAMGIGAQAGSITMVVFLVIAVASVFYFVVLQEEAFLATTFGSDFAAYAARVPRFLPRLSVWQEADQLVVKPRLVRRTFLDASLFLLAVPFCDVIERMHALGWLPVLLSLR